MKQFVLKHPTAIVAVAVAAIAVALLVAALWPKFTDSDIAYCLSEEHRPELVDAAVALGLAKEADHKDQLKVGPLLLTKEADHKDQLKVDDRETNLEDWRSHHQGDFQRSCLALNPPRRLNPLEELVSAESGLVGVLGVMVGGGIYYLSERTRDRALRRVDEARRLNDLGTTFKATVENFVSLRSAAIRTELPVNQIREHRNALVSELRLVRARYPGWGAADDPLTMLDGVLSDQLLEGWGDQHRRADELRTAVNQLADQISSIAVELERGGLTASRR